MPVVYSLPPGPPPFFWTLYFVETSMSPEPITTCFSNPRGVLSLAMASLQAPKVPAKPWKPEEKIACEPVSERDRVQKGSSDGPGTKPPSVTFRYAPAFSQGDCLGIKGAYHAGQTETTQNSTTTIAMRLCRSWSQGTRISRRWYTATGGSAQG